VGIAVALAGGEEWAAADDWAALAAAGVIGWNALRILRPAVADLMDRSAPPPVLERLRAAALGVPGVVMVEKLKARRAGLGLFVDIHAQAEPDLTLRAAHVLSGKVKSAIRDAVPATLGVLVHMEPWEGGPVH
jgi:divalent metal cation (Fe/Co/Zn/Cd) transporter